jgi:glutathione S-transferase
VIELWHEWTSVHSLKVRIVLAEKGLEWHSRPVELLKFEHLQPEYLAINPNGVVPTLVHDGTPIYESSPICEYLEEMFPEPPLRPDDALGRARMRAWLKYHDDVLHPALRAASFELLYKPYLRTIPHEELPERLRRHPQPERRKKFLDGARDEIDWDNLVGAARACILIAEHIDRALSGSSQWLLGNRFTLADIATAPFVERVENLGLESLVWAGRASGTTWARCLGGRPAVQRSRPPASHRMPVPARQTLEELQRRMSA